MLSVANFQPASLIAPTGKKQWTIAWYNYNPQTSALERIRRTFDLNRIKDKRERRRIANSHIAIINDRLRKGWNYFIHYLGIPDNRIVYAPLNPTDLPQRKTTILQALQKGLDARVLGREKTTADSYRSFNNLITQWLTENGYTGMAVDDFKLVHFQDYITYKHSLGHGNRNINDHIGYFRTTFDKIKRLYSLKENPIDGLDMLPVGESTKFELITDEELATISQVLREKHTLFYVFTKFIALEFIRPLHVTRLQAKQIDYERNVIRLNSTTTKNKKVIEKQLMPGMKQLLMQMHYHELPGEYYLFGDRKFVPGPNKYPSLSKRAAETWRELIIEGEGINKYMYALKHTGASNYVDKNINLDLSWLMKHMEHSNLAITQIYIEKRKGSKLDTDNAQLIDY